MPRLHLRPIPSADVIAFPPRQAEDRETVVRQFSSLLALLTQRSGAFLGRERYIEASVAAVTRVAFAEGSLHNTRKSIEEAFDEELDRLEPVAPGWA